MQTKEQQREGEKDNLIFGLRPVMEALRSGKEIDKLLIQSFPPSFVNKPSS